MSKFFIEIVEIIKSISLIISLLIISDDITSITSISGMFFSILTRNSSEVPIPVVHVISVLIFLGLRSISRAKYSVKNPISSSEMVGNSFLEI